MKKQFSFFLLTALFFQCALAQSSSSDSLINALLNRLKEANHDTVRCSVLTELIEASDENSWLTYNDELLKLTENKIKSCDPASAECKIYKKNKAFALLNLGEKILDQKKYTEAMEYCTTAYKLYREIDNKSGIAEAINKIGLVYYKQKKFEPALFYYDYSLKAHDLIGDKKGMAYVYNPIGTIYEEQGETEKALEAFSKGLKLSEDLKDNEEIGKALNNISGIYYRQGNIPKALACYERSLKLKEAAGDKEGVAGLFNNLGLIYNEQGDPLKAMEYYKKSLALCEEIGNKKGIAYAYNNFGLFYKNNGDPTVTSSPEESRRAGLLKALEYYQRSYTIREEMGNKGGMAMTLNNIGTLYSDCGDPFLKASKEEAAKAGEIKALEYLHKSLQLREEIRDKNGTANSLFNIGNIYAKQKNYNKAINYYKEAMQLNRELGFPRGIKNAARELSKLYRITGKDQLALENYELYIQMRDSLTNEETKKATIKSQLKYEYEKKAAADSVKTSEEKKVVQAQLKQEKTQRYSLYGGLALVLIFALFMVNRFRVTNKQKKLIEEQKKVVEAQKHLVEEKQNEILDSIRYAKRIQTALVSSEYYINKELSRLNSKD